MRLIQASIIPLILLATMLSTGCTMPVCCGPESDVPLFHPGTEKRIRLIEYSLELFSQRKFEQLTALYADETRPEFAVAMKKKESQVSDDEIKGYVEGMHAYVFSKEGRVGDQDRWHVAYESELEKGKYIVYTLVKEEGEYRLVDIKAANAQ